MLRVLCWIVLGFTACSAPKSKRPNEKAVLVTKMAAQKSTADDSVLGVYLVSSGTNGTSFESLENSKIMLLDPKVSLSPPHFASATQTNDAQGHPGLLLELNDSGRKRFHELTEANRGRTLAFVVAGKVVKTTVIKEGISNGRIYLSVSKSEWMEPVLTHFSKAK